MDDWQTEVLVVGGGTAGVTAAIAAAEEGSDVVLVERDSSLGGVGVRAGVHFYYLGTTGGVQDSLDETVE
jgi:heterodisulfide reductase subunit A-like polyferredoxin